MAVTKPANDVLTARLAGLSLPAGGAWATEARKTALDRLNAHLSGPGDPDPET